MPASKIQTDTPITTYYIKKTDGSNTSIRKLSDDITKKKLSNVEPTDVERRMSIIRKDSVGSDSHWPGWSDLRRLSEAGVRRSSDSSIVLTEDTDGFIIGDRVWVGGNKPGQIAYIGETQFAPGDWAGIVLDQPIGKNDGSVGGVRYFQCEPKRGIFSRLTRLTRRPLFGAGEDINESERIIKTVQSPRTSVTSPPKSVVSSPTSPSSNSPGKNSDLKVGDRVIVMSSMGSKAGMLRYLGPIDVAPGMWCGVELDDPLGKNDGSLSGKRYFDCIDNFGVFVPIHKVSKSPKGNRKPSTPSCEMHPAGSGYKKNHSGSRESLNSTVTNASSIKSTSRKPSAIKPSSVSPGSGKQSKTPLQELLDQKQQHIEQLLKERDLERAEVTRAASQAEQAEHDLAVMKQEFAQLKEMTLSKNNDNELLISQLISEKRELANILEDERKRYEDLQFSYEEESIIRADLEAKLTKNEEKLKYLENYEEKNQEALEVESNKLFEAEEALTRIKDEYEALRIKFKDLENEKKDSDVKYNILCESKSIENNTKLTERLKEIEELKKRYELIENSNMEMSKSIDELTKKNNLNYEKYQSEIKKCNDEISKLKNELLESENKFKDLEEKSNKFSNESNEHKSANNKLVNDNILNQNIIKELEEKVKAHEKMIEHEKSSQTVKEKQIEELKKQMEIELKKFKDKELQFNSEINDVKSLLKKQLDDYNLLNTTKTEMENLFTESLNESNMKYLDLEKKNNECEKIVENLTTKLKEFDSNNFKLTQKFEEREKELIVKIDSLQSSSENFNKDYENRFQNILLELKMKESELSSANESLKKIVNENSVINEKLDIKIKEHENLNQQFNSLTESIEKKETLFDKEKETMMSDILLKDDLINQLKKTIVSNEELEKEMKENLSLSNKKINELELKVGDLTSQLAISNEKCSQLNLQKSKLEGDISDLMNSSAGSSSQLSKLNDQLRSKEGELEKLRESFNEETLLAKNNALLKKQECDEMIKKLDESSKNISQLENKLLENDNVHKKLKDDFDALNKYKEEISVKYEKLEKENYETDNKLQCKDNELKELILELESLEESKKKLVKENEEKINNAITSDNDLRASIKLLKVDCDNFKKDANDLLNSKVMMEEKLKNFENLLSEKDKNLDECIKMKDQFCNEKMVLEKKIIELNEQIEKSQEFLNKKDFAYSEVCKQRDFINDENIVIKKQLDEKNVIIESVQSKLNAIGSDLLDNVQKYDEIKLKLNDERIKLMEEKDHIKKLLTSKELEFNEMAKEMVKLKEHVACHQKSVEDKNCTINEQNKVVELLTSDLSNLKNNLIKLNEEKIEVEERLKLSNSEIDKLKTIESQSKDNSGKEITRLKEENESLRFKLAQTEEKVSSEDKNLMKMLNNYELNSKQLKEELQQSEASQKQLKNKIEMLNEKQKEDCQQINCLQNSIENYVKICQKKDEEVATLQTEVKSLLDLKSQFLKSKNHTETLEKQKALLEETVSKLKDEVNKKNVISGSLGSNDNNNNSNSRIVQKTIANGGPASAEKQNEDNEMLHGQINFLNSIIVDLQSKNDLLQSRINHLESGEPDQMGLNEIKSRTVAPRLFCDICDVFDAHDTEDCPKQMSSSRSSPISSQKVSYPRGYERPYCDNCEIFGHNTVDCVDETF